MSIQSIAHCLLKNNFFQHNQAIGHFMPILGILSHSDGTLCEGLTSSVDRAEVYAPREASGLQILDKRRASLVAVGT